MKLIALLTHGMGDWYGPLTILPNFMQSRNIDINDLEILVDSIYFVYPDVYSKQKETGIKLIESVTKNWKPVPSEFFGSDDFHGIPDRRSGPIYQNIKHDFLFYRRAPLKSYIRSYLEQQREKFGEVVFLSCTGRWTYEWVDNQNVPIDLSRRTPLKLSISNDQKDNLNGLIKNNTLLIHVRKRGATITDKYYQNIINHCNTKGIHVILVGLQSEVNINITENVTDLRERITPEETFYLIENSPFMLCNNSMYCGHRLTTNKKTISCIMESNGCRENYYFDDELNNENYKFFDSDSDHINQIFNLLNGWINE